VTASADLDDSVHNWYDVLFGAVIGTCTSIVAFRQTFASLFDYRFNHLLLPRTASPLQSTPAYPLHKSGIKSGSVESRTQADHGPVTRDEGWDWSPEAAADDADAVKED
jgi:hypothetical protein